MPPDPPTPPWQTDAARALVARLSPAASDSRAVWLDALHDALTGRTGAAAAAHLGVGLRTLRRWLAALAEGWPDLHATLPIAPEGRPATGGAGSRGGTSRQTVWRATRGR